MWNRTWCGVEGGRWEVEAREKSQRESQDQAQTAESGLQPRRITKESRALRGPRSPTFCSGLGRVCQHSVQLRGLPSYWVGLNRHRSWAEAPGHS